MSHFRVALFVVLAVCCVQPLRAAAREERVVLQHHVPQRLTQEHDAGVLAGDEVVRDILINLQFRDGAESEIEQLAKEQVDPASPLFHRWLTPDEVGRRFGPSDWTIDVVEEWLQQQHLDIDEITPARNTIRVHGRAADVERAFATELHWYGRGERRHYANRTDPSLPREIAGAVRSVLGLDDFPVVNAPAQNDGDRFTTHSLAPGDIDVIYNAKPLLDAGYTGRNVTIAVVGEAEVDQDAVRAFQTRYHLPTRQVQVQNVAPLPAPDSCTDLTRLRREVHLDVEWAGAIARDAAIKLYLGPSILDAVKYIVDFGLAPIISISFSGPEPPANTGWFVEYQHTAKLAAIEGITIVAGSGDWGPANSWSEAHDPCPTQRYVRSINYLCAPAEVTCVGGTEFNDSPGYWKWFNDSDGTSAQQYIPESGWNDAAGASGGGVSSAVSVPSWQYPTFTTNNYRTVPDIALPAAANVQYNVVTKDSKWVRTEGTSAATPTFASILALIVQKTGSWQGNINPTLYALGKKQYFQSGPEVFHDITSGTNTWGDFSGDVCWSGYDLVTGLGSIDAKALADNWIQPSLAPSPIVVSQPLTFYPVSPVAGSPVTATFSLTNNGDDAVTLGVVTAGGRNSSGGVTDFPFAPCVSIAAHATYTYSKSQTFSAGTYGFFPAYETMIFGNACPLPDNRWNTDIAPASGVRRDSLANPRSVTVGSSTTPAPSITSVTISPTLGCVSSPSRRWVTLHGTNFPSNATLYLHGDIDYTVPPDRTQWVSAIETKVCVGFGTWPNWEVWMSPPPSAHFPFVAPGSAPSDTTAPAVVITWPCGSSCQSTASTITISGTASDSGGSGLDKVFVYNLTNGSFGFDYGPAGGSSTFSVGGITLATGSNNVLAQAYDNAGNYSAVSSITITYVVSDTSHPQLTISSPAAGATVTNGSVTVSGTASDQGRGDSGVASVTVNGSAASGATASGSGTASWSATVALHAGYNDITVVARDDSPNQNAVSQTVTVLSQVPSDSSAPTLQVDSPTSNPAYSSSSTPLLVAGRATDDVGIARVGWTNDRGGAGDATLYTYANNTTWTIPAIDLSTGTNVLTITAYDLAGNATNATLTVTYTPIAGVETIATGLSNPFLIALDDTNLYVCDSYGLKWIPRNGGSPVLLVPYADALAIDGANIYYGTDTGISKMPKSGGSATLLVSGYEQRRLATDGTYLYWAEYQKGNVRRIPIAGGSVTNISSDPSMFPAGLAVDATGVYWTTAGVYPSSVWKSVLNGGNWSSGIFADHANTWGIASDGTNVFWSENVFSNDGRINRAPVTAGSGWTALASGLSTVPSDVAIDQTNVYWVAFGFNGSINRVPKNGGASTVVAGNLADPVSVATDGTWIYWLERNGGQNGNGTLRRIAAGASATDTTPDEFAFPTKIDVPLSSSVISDATTITGIDTASPISITNGQYSINDGALMSSVGTISAGQSVRVSLTSSASYSTATVATLTIGGVSGTFTAKTIAEPDVMAPDTTITSGPSGTVATRSATFTWSGSDDRTAIDQLQFATRLDPIEAAYTPFGSGTTRTFSDLPDGSYTFYVKARDAAGNEDPSPATRTFSVSAGPTQHCVTSFANGPVLSIGKELNQVAIADFDGDGKPDLAVSVYSPAEHRVAVYRNTSTSSTPAFAARLDFTVDAEPEGLIAGDVDGDGKPDLLSANAGGGTVSILRNTSTSGSIQFAAQITLATPGTPHRPVLADFDNDGKLDLVVTCNSPRAAAIYRNQSTPGSISFTQSFTLDNLASYPDPVAAADFDGDGKIDLAIPIQDVDTIYLFRNTTTGSAIAFTQNGTLATLRNPFGVAAADLDGDGKPDLVAVNTDAGSLSLYRNVTTSNVFAFASRIDAGIHDTPLQPLLTDLDGDGRKDILVANSGADSLSLFTNQSSAGTLSFPDRSDITVGDHPWFLAAGDLNGDQKPDVVTTKYPAGELQVLANNSPACAPIVAPTGLTATRASSGGITVTWQPSSDADHYEVLRTSSIATTAGVIGTAAAASFTDSTASSGTAYLYSVRAVAADGRRSAASNVDLAVAVAFSDDPIVARVTIVRAPHMAELRAAVNGTRARAGLAPLTGSAPSAHSIILGSDISVIRTGLIEALNVLGMPVPSLLDPVLVPGVTPVRAAHVQQLRDAMK